MRGDKDLDANVFATRCGPLTPKATPYDMIMAPPPFTRNPYQTPEKDVSPEPDVSSRLPDVLSRSVSSSSAPPSSPTPSPTASQMTSSGTSSLPPAGISRRAWFGRMATGAGVAAVTVGVGASVAAWHGGRNCRVVRRTVKVPGLDPRLSGVRLAQVSDTHIKGDEWEPSLREAARLLRQETVDIVTFTGDIWHHESGLGGASELMRTIRGTSATLFTPGNWDYAASQSLRKIRSVVEATDTHVLANQWQDVPLRGTTLRCAGLDDLRFGQPDTVVTGAAVRETPTVLLVHEPGQMEMLPPHWGRTAVTVSGHTHGGHICLAPNVPIVLPEGSGSFVSGWYELGTGPLYVSRGLGGAIPYRLFAPPDISIITLEPAEPASRKPS